MDGNLLLSFSLTFLVCSDFDAAPFCSGFVFLDNFEFIPVHTHLSDLLLCIVITNLNNTCIQIEMFSLKSERDVKTI